MSSLKLRYEKFCDFMEKNTKGVEIGIYSVSGLLFAISYYKIRPITKFGNPFDIPKHFITEKVVQNGLVKSIEPNQVTGAILRVDHKPPINIFFTSEKTLPVKIHGVEVNGNGYSWLQSVTLNQKVRFLPLIRTENFAECQVKMLQDPATHEKPSIDLGESLISLGFARIVNPNVPKHITDALTKDEQLKRYYKHLEKIQTKAKLQRNGLWSSIIPPPPWPIRFVKQQISNVLYNKILPTKQRLPELVR